MSDQPIYRRTFPVHLATAAAEVDTTGRIVEGRCVPYGVASRVQDAPNSEPYLELFAPGAFSRAVKAPDRVHFRYAHGSGIGDMIGRGVTFTETPEGLDGCFRVLRGVFGDQALELVDEGMLTGLSVGFQSLARRDRHTAEGAVIRERCHLVEVSLTGEPAYAGAMVTGRREAPRAELLARPVRDDQLTARLRAVGVDV